MLTGLLAVKAALVRLLEWIVIAVVAALVMDVLWGVFSRFVLRSPSRWTEEVATTLLIWVSLLGAAVAFGRGEHLGIDYVTKKFDPSVRRLMAILVQLLVALFAGAVMVFGGYILVSETLRAGQLLPALGIRSGHVYLAVPISGVFILLFCLERIAELVSGRGDGAMEPQAGDETASTASSASDSTRFSE
ncbi:MAG: TRAP transporter small permease [Pirellulaceae bacterium]|nr:TRAP transporter small permease [Pirellulaceae bacterium]